MKPGFGFSQQGKKGLPRITKAQPRERSKTNLIFVKLLLKERILLTESESLLQKDFLTIADERAGFSSTVLPAACNHEKNRQNLMCALPSEETMSPADAGASGVAWPWATRRREQPAVAGGSLAQRRSLTRQESGKEQTGDF